MFHSHSRIHFTKTMRLFICPILALTFLTTHSNLLAQIVNEEQAINKLLQTSNQLLDDDELIASKLLPMTWADLPLDIKASPKIQFCYYEKIYPQALFCLIHLQ